MEKDNMKIMFADDIASSSFDPTGGLLKSIIEQQRNKEKARWMVLVIVTGVLSVFLIGNLALYAYAHKSLPKKAKKKKPVSAKKMKKEKLKLGVSPPGE